MDIDRTNVIMSPLERRLNTISRHLIQGCFSDSTSIVASPAFYGASVFQNIAQAPEDPILGVTIHVFSFLFYI